MRKGRKESREATGRYVSVFDPMKLQAWFARIACVFLSLSFYSFYQSTVNQTKSFVLPLELRLGKDTSVLQTDATSATIYAKGPEKEVRRLKISDLNVYAGNATVSGDGQGAFPIFLERKGDAADQMEVSFSVYPEKVYVIYERSMTKRVPVNVLLAGTPAKGYVPIASVSPGSVVISGPKSVVESMKEINTIPIDIEKKRQPFTVGGALEYPQNTSLLYDEKIEVVVNFIRPGKTMTFEGLIPEIFNLEEGLQIVSEMPLISVKLTSKDINLDELNLKDLRLILDCAEIKSAGNFEIPLQAVVSHRGLGIEIDPARVSVEVKERTPVDPPETEETGADVQSAAPVSDTLEAETDATGGESATAVPPTPSIVESAPASDPESAGPSVNPDQPAAASSAVESERDPAKSVGKDVEHGEARQAGPSDVLH